MSNLKFYVPSCAMCPAMKKVGPVGHEIRYCTGFPVKKQKRLPKNSLKKGVASWCPKQISPPACRVLGFVDEDTAMLEYMLNSEKYAAGQDVQDLFHCHGSGGAVLCAAFLPEIHRFLPRTHLWHPGGGGYPQGPVCPYADDEL